MSDLHFSPYDTAIFKDPYPTLKRLREEAPVYYNEADDFYALSRYDDVRAALKDHETFSSAKGDILELIKLGAPLPPGTFIMEDPPEHTVHRALVQKIFAPRRMLELETSIRKITQDCLDRIVGREEFDFIADIGAQIPMRVIGALLGIPESDYAAVRDSVDARLTTDEGKKMDLPEGDYGIQIDESFGDYIDWRIREPADDVISELLAVRFTDEKGIERNLSREEILTFVNVLAGAGNETTNKVIGWTGKLLAEHPEQRALLVANPALIPDAIEEILRYETPGPAISRYVAQDITLHGVTIRAGSATMLLVASANRDADFFNDPDRFDITRERSAHTTFGYGIHTCVGNVLARTELRVVIEELLLRFPEWDVDLDNASLLNTSTVRGWETLPAYTSPAGLALQQARRQAAIDSQRGHALSTPELAGEWLVSIKGPTGAMDSALSLSYHDGSLSGVQSGDGQANDIDSIDYDEATGEMTWVNKISKPMKMTLTFSGSFNAQGEIEGKVKAGMMGKWDFVARKE